MFPWLLDALGTWLYHLKPGKVRFSWYVTFNSLSTLVRIRILAPAGWMKNDSQVYSCQPHTRYNVVFFFSTVNWFSLSVFFLSLSVCHILVWMYWIRAICFLQIILFILSQNCFSSHLFHAWGKKQPIIRTQSRVRVWGLCDLKQRENGWPISL